MKRKLLSAVMALMLLLTAVCCGTAPTSSSEPEPAPYLPDPAPAQTVCEFTYDDELGVQEFTPESSGYYLLEVWGAQGGDCTGKKGEVSYSRYGGKGGYSKGYVWLNKGEPVYICVGSKGGNYDDDEGAAEGGYNGGGSASKSDKKINHVFGGGGGATHIALTYGSLANLAAHKNSVLIVAGGGGGARWQSNMDHTAARFGNGGAGGGEMGGVGQHRDASITDSHANWESYKLLAGSQASGFEFGQGQSTEGGQAGGGGGWYGGYSGSKTPGIGSGSGGSGYIDGVLLGVMESGVWQGNGKAVITWAGNTEDTIPEGLTIPQA